MKKQSYLLIAFLLFFQGLINAMVEHKTVTETSIKTEKTWVGQKFNDWLTKKVEKKLKKLLEECDLIYLQDGSEISAKISEITETDIKYKKCTNLNGPNITISKGKVWKIKYANGEIDIINKLGSTGNNNDDRARNNDSNNNSNDQKTDGRAIAGMVTGIASILLLGSWLGLACGVVGIVLSLIGLKRIKNDPKRLKGKGLAKAGLICSIIGCALVVLSIASVL